MNGPRAERVSRQRWSSSGGACLRRRSQGNHLTWRRMGAYVARWLPPARICHPYPRVRFAVITRGKSRMR